MTWQGECLCFAHSNHSWFRKFSLVLLLSRKMHLIFLVTKLRNSRDRKLHIFLLSCLLRPSSNKQQFYSKSSFHAVTGCESLGSWSVNHTCRQRSSLKKRCISECHSAVLTFESLILYLLKNYLVDKRWKLTSGLKKAMNQNLTL